MDAVGKVAQQFGVYWPNLIAQIILFGIVYYVLKKFAFQAVISMLEERRRRIEEGQLNAEKIKRQLAEAQTKYEEILAKANADSQRLLEEVRASGDRLAEQKRQEAIAAAEQIALKAQESMALERDKIMAEMKQELGRLVVDTTARVTGKVLSPQDQERINEEAARQIAA
jgi:F-type H+-transporting ATPase subunit b